MKKLLVGNKADLTSRRTVEKKSAETMARALEMPYIETSAKLSENVEAAFIAMAREIKKQFNDYPEAEVTTRDIDGSIFIQGTPVTATTTPQASSSCCGGKS